MTSPAQSNVRVIRRPEAVLERQVLLEIGRIQRDIPLLDIAKNEVGLGYKQTARDTIDRALVKLQASFGPVAIPIIEAARAVVREELRKHHITYGLGVGSPDLVGAVNGRWLGIELKTDTGVLSDAQKQWHAAARARGQFVTVVRDPGELRPAVIRCIEGKLQ